MFLPRHRRLLIVGIILVAALLAVVVLWMPGGTVGPERAALRERIGRLDWDESETYESLLKETRAASAQQRKLIEAELVRGLRTHRDPGVRAACAFCLNSLKRRIPGATEALAAALEDDVDRSVRVNAALGLGRLGTESELPVLWGAVQRWRDASGSLKDTGVAAARAIGDIGGRAAAQLLMELWQDSTLPRNLNGIVVFSMGRTGDLRCLEPIQAALWSPESGKELRSYAASALTDLMGTADSAEVKDILRPVFRRCIQDPLRDVRSSGVIGLSECGVEEDIPRLQALLDRETRPFDQKTLRFAISVIEERAAEKAPQ